MEVKYPDQEPTTKKLVTKPNIYCLFLKFFVICVFSWFISGLFHCDNVDVDIVFEIRQEKLFEPTESLFIIAK